MDTITTTADGTAHEQHDAPETTEPKQIVYQLWLIVLAFFARMHEKRGLDGMRIVWKRAPGAEATAVGNGSNGRARQFARFCSERAAALLDHRLKPSVASVRRFANECGFVLIFVYTAENVYQLYHHLHERAHHAHVVLGLSKGASLFSLYTTLAVQAISLLVLSFQRFYEWTGPLTPSACLTIAALVEAVVFGDAGDATTMLSLLCVSLASLLLALFRTDRKHRERAAQLPADSRLLRLEERVRGACTRYGLAASCPPLALVSLYSAYSNQFWIARPLLYEYVRARHQVAVAAASLLLLLGAQDIEGHRRMARLCEGGWEFACATAERLARRPRSVHRGLGDRKKHI